MHFALATESSLRIGNYDKRELNHKNCIEMFPNFPTCTHVSRDLSHACITHGWTIADIAEGSLTVRSFTAILGCHPELVIMPRF